MTASPAALGSVPEVSGRLDDGFGHLQELRTDPIGLLQRVRDECGDVVFVSSDVAVRVRPFVSAYATGKWGLEGMAQSMQMELEGTGVRASIVRPGPTWSEIGDEWEAEAGARVIEAWVRFGLARHPRFLKPAALADAIVTVVRAPRGVHLNLVEVTPEAPLEET